MVLNPAVLLNPAVAKVAKVLPLSKQIQFGSEPISRPNPILNGQLNLAIAHDSLRTLQPSISLSSSRRRSDE